MRIGLNLLFVAPGVAGGRVYGEELLRGLAAVDASNEYIVYTRRDTTLPDLPGRFQQIRAPVSGSSALWRTAWEYGFLPARARQDRCDLLHGLGNISPSFSRGAFVLTIHDMIYRHFPQSLPLGHRLFMRGVHARVARRADLVIVPSQHSAEEVVKFLGVRRERLRLVRYGPGQGFHPVTDPLRIEHLLQRYGVRRPFVVSVARGYPHKNLGGLLRSLARLWDMGHRETQLVLIGDRYQVGGELERLTHQLKLNERVVHTGFVNQADLNTLYSAATVFAFPSLAEGLGLPVLEAMACGTPVVASNAAAIPEAVGEAGLLADARNPDEFASAMARLLEDSDLREDFRQKGFARVREFSWERCAAETVAVYRELV
jgi:glycosyltransferase involved in cell wall biosynthesis